MDAPSEGRKKKKTYDVKQIRGIHEEEKLLQPLRESNHQIFEASTSMYVYT